MRKKGGEDENDKKKYNESTQENENEKHGKDAQCDLM
jgi:hypothetical protein